MASQLKHTVMPSGGDFTSFDAAIDHLAASHADLVSADVYADIEIDGTWSSADTTGVYTGGITTDATRYINVYTTAKARHSGSWDTGAYILSHSADDITIYCEAEVIKIDGLQIIKTHSTNTGDLFYNTGASNTTISNSIIRRPSTAGSGRFCTVGTDGRTIKLYNCIIYGGGFSNYFYDNWYNGVVTAYSCTFVGASGVGFNRVGSGTWTLKNCYVQSSDTCIASGVTLTTTATSDTSGTLGLRDIAANTTQFINVTAASEDFHLAGTGSALYNAGTDTSGDSAPFNFTTDIDGDTRSTWDIGADEYVAAGGASIPRSNPFSRPFQQSLGRGGF